MKSTAPVRIHLNIPEDESERLSFDLNFITPLPSTVTLDGEKLTTNIQKLSSNSFDKGRAAARFSNVSSSYAQFLKQRDINKVQKIVSSLSLLEDFSSFFNSLIRNLHFLVIS